MARLPVAWPQEDGHVLLEHPSGLILCDDPARLDFGRIRAWLADSYWAAGRDAQTIEKSFAHSHPYGVYTADGTQVALARVTTDYATFAWLGDVVVDETWRGRGIGRWLVASVVDSLRAQGVPRFVLATRDAHDVYASVGFEPVRYPSFWMEIDLRADRPTPVTDPR
jgi:GNAT superfamily N-acetyltransferase